MYYTIRFGKLKGLTPKEAFEQGKVKDLIEIQTILKENFLKPEYERYKQANLEGYLAIEKVLLEHYQGLLQEFADLMNQLTEDKKKELLNRLDKNIFRNNDILGLKEIIEQIKKDIQKPN